MQQRTDDHTPRLRRQTPRRSRAFTLVELLVVIGIIALLIAILMPTLGKARELGKRTSCMSQMRQIGSALVMYANEWSGKSPMQIQDVTDFGDPAVYESTNPNNWSGLGKLLPYIGGQKAIFTCPTAGEEPWTAPAWGSPTPLSDTNYMVNGAVFDRRLTKIRNSSEIVWVQEDRFRWNIAWRRPVNAGMVNGRPTYSLWCFYNGPVWGQEYTSVHNGGGNLVFVDGHAEWRHNTDMRPTDFGLTGGLGVSGKAEDLNDVPHDWNHRYFSVFD